MASEILSAIATAQAECEEKIRLQREKAQQAESIAKNKADEIYNALISEAKQTAEGRLSQAKEYADVLADEQRKRTEEEINAMKKAIASKESPTVLAVAKKILELS